MSKLWGGRFRGEADSLAIDFHSSIGFDQRMYAEDICGSIAHAEMLAACGIISPADSESIVTGLQALAKEIAAGQVEFDTAAEDIHMNLETLLTERIGEAGKRLHTARSRNDQVALDLRLYLRGQIVAIQSLLKQLLETLSHLASAHQHTLLPGFTHLQKAQPITFSHHLLAYAQMFLRDWERLADCNVRMSRSPLGSCALAGTGFPIDRQQTATALGFDGPTANSIDGVSDRDFALEFLSACSIAMMHLSRFCEEIVLWSSYEFGYITLADAYSTGSSIMPQKKNPDMAELIRGKTGRVYGDLMALLTVMKGLPLAYNKDMQEDKEAVFDGVDTLKSCLTIFIPMLATMKVNIANMEADLRSGFLNATDLADYLVDKGLPFRETHGISGTLVKLAEAKGCALEELPLVEMQAVCNQIDSDVYAALTPQACVAKRRSYGGPAPEATTQALQELEQWLSKH